MVAQSITIRINTCIIAVFLHFHTSKGSKIWHHESSSELATLRHARAKMKSIKPVGLGLVLYICQVAPILKSLKRGNVPAWLPLVSQAQESYFLMKPIFSSRYFKIQFFYQKCVRLWKHPTYHCCSPPIIYFIFFILFKKKKNKKN